MKVNKTQSLFPSLVRAAGCASDFAIARLANGTAPHPQDLLAHARVCEKCRARIEESRAQHAVAITEPVPPALLIRLSEDLPAYAPLPKDNTKAIMPLRRVASIAGVAASFAVLLVLFLRPEQQPQIRTKGNGAGWNAVTVDVRRGDVLVRSSVPLTTLQEELAAGDQIRFYVDGGGKNRWVRFFSQSQAGAWEQLFSGVSPASGQPLPVAVEITAHGRTRLRFEFCPTENSDNGCSQKIFDL